MGINDKDYADALEHQRVHAQALMKLELQKQQGSLEQAIKNAADRLAPKQATISTTYPAKVVSTGTYIAPSMTQSGSKVLNEQDLRHDAMKAPLSALIDMWTMRWQGEWVSEDVFQEDDFWRLALIRLVGANRLEKHHLANQYAAVYRIIE
jgi:hypothetical protein